MVTDIFGRKKAFPITDIFYCISIYLILSTYLLDMYCLQCWYEQLVPNAVCTHPLKMDKIHFLFRKKRT